MNHVSSIGRIDSNGVQTLGARLRRLISGLIGLFLLCSSAPLAAQQSEEADGSFNLDVAGDVDVQLIFSKAAFRNYFLIVQPATAPATCSTGSTTLNQCFVDTGPCDACPQGGPGDFSCACIYNDTQFLGNFAAGTNFQAQLQVDEGRDGTIDNVWYWNTSMNADSFDHLRTFKIFDGTWVLQWEDQSGGGDQDFNDVVTMIRTRPAARPPGAVSFPAPSLYYVTNVIVEDQGLPDRKVRMTLILYNDTVAAITAAPCPMLNFSDVTVPNGQVYTFNNNDNIPDCLGAPSPMSISARFSREQRTTNSCPHPAPLTGDQVTVPAATGTVPGQVALEYELRLADIDAFVPNAADKLESKTATQILDGIRNHPLGLYTDIIYNLQVPSIVCPNGPITFYTAAIPATVGAASYTWNHPNTYNVASPITIQIGTVNAETMAPNPAIEAFIDYLWADNLPVHLRGHIDAQIPPRTPFLSGEFEIDHASVTLNFPDDLPSTFQGKLEAIVREVATGRVLVTATELFTKDGAPPTVANFVTTRTANGLEVSGVVSDPLSAIGRVRLSPTVNGTAARPEYMHRAEGDFFGETQMSASFAGLLPLDRVAVELNANDTNLNETVSSLPVANTGGDRNVECTSPQGAEVTLDGSLSSVPPGSSATWTGPFGSETGLEVSVPLPLGPNNVTLSITDPQGFVGTQTSAVSVVDTVPPKLGDKDPLCFERPHAKHGFVVVRADRDLERRVKDICDAHPDVEIDGVKLARDDDHDGNDDHDRDDRGHRHGDKHRGDKDNDHDGNHGSGGTKVEGAVVFPDHVCLPIEKERTHYVVDVTLSDDSGNERESRIDLLAGSTRHCDRLRPVEVVGKNDPICKRPPRDPDCSLAAGDGSDTGNRFELWALVVALAGAWAGRSLRRRCPG